MAASVPEQLGEERPNRQPINPQDDGRGAINDGSFTGRWADRYPREKTSLPLFADDESKKELKDKRKEDARKGEARDKGDARDEPQADNPQSETKVGV